MTWTTTTVIEFFKSANKLDVDINLLCDVAKLGSGNSGALNRIADKALQGDFKGYVFSVNNTLKDLTYINDLLKNSNNAKELTNIAMNFYTSAKDKGMGDLLVSELDSQNNELHSQRHSQNNTCYKSMIDRWMAITKTFAF